jgi:hypothetical protein
MLIGSFEEIRMTTPFFNFSPRFPWSGDVIQDIEPQTSWFFGSIAPEAGDGRIERHIALDIASYGKQLSALLDVVHDLVQDARVSAAHRATFDALYQRVGDAKVAHKRTAEDAARAALQRLRDTDQDALARVLNEYRTK